jgi:hypothetical protein
MVEIRQVKTRIMHNAQRDTWLSPHVSFLGEDVEA